MNLTQLKQEIFDGLYSSDEGLYITTPGRIEEIIQRVVSELEKEVVPQEAKKHDNLIDPDSINGDEDTDYDWCGVDISAHEAKCFNLCREQILDSIRKFKSEV